MTRGEQLKEALIVLGTAAVASLLFWMALYIGGPTMLIPAAAVLCLMLLRFRTRMVSARLVAERGVLACLLAAQASLFVAIMFYVVPDLLRQASSLV